MAWRWGWAALGLALIYFCCKYAMPWPGPVYAVPDLAPGEKPAGKLARQGAASCSAMACHNGNQARETPGSEYTTWAALDPHARAYEVLWNKQSATISKNLQRGKAAHKDGLCLSCHVHPNFQETDPGGLSFREDGVSCESCHGPAEKWLTVHYKSEWKTKSTVEKLAWGMTDTKSVPGRAASCVGCHVGALHVDGRMDVNHDLIAAGHPRLNFEFGAYHANMPHHWDDRKDKDPKFDKRGSPDFEVRAWVIGQLVSAQAALELLAERADSKPGRIWPEFAEYDCFACHHQLQGKSWRQEKDLGDRKPGSLPWGTWYFAALPELAFLSDGPKEKSAANALQDLRKVMEAKIVPDRQVVAAQAAKTATLLRELIKQYEGRKFTVTEIAALFTHAAKLGAVRSGNSWDDAAQAYLALAALNQGWRDLGKTAGPPLQLNAEMKKLLVLLQFPGPPNQLNSPGPMFSPAKIVQQFQTLSSYPK